MEAALRSSPATGGTTASESIAAQLLALLSGHQVATAAALAAATGNPRLATLLAQAGAKAVGAAQLAEQLRVGDDLEIFGRIYRLIDCDERSRVRKR